MEPPEFPVGPFREEKDPFLRKDELITSIEHAPRNLRAAVQGLTDAQLDTLYRNWTLRQIVHHLADSHLNSFVRFRLALTESTPTIKPYDEGLWSGLPDSRTAEVGTSLRLLEGLHARWGILLRSMEAEDYARTFFHPETGKELSLAYALGSYEWHGRHHTGQILWRRKREGWG